MERRSKRKRLTSPCSRSARAAAKASVPAPPVTAQDVSFSFMHLGLFRYGGRKVFNLVSSV